MTKGLTELLKYFRDERHYASEKRTKALVAISNALQKTKQYIVLRNDHLKPRNIEKEHELSDLWSQASIFAREFSPEFAKRLQVKGNYWLNPDEWEFDEIYDSGIHIDRIDMEVQDLLNRRP